MTTTNVKAALMTEETSLNSKNTQILEIKCLMIDFHSLDLTQAFSMDDNEK